MLDEEIVMQQARKNLTINIQYQGSGDSSPKTRRLEPYSYRVLGGKKFLMAIDINKRDHIRSFDVNKVSETEASTKLSQLIYPVEI